jgi:hypothetical protein
MFCFVSLMASYVFLLLELLKDLQLTLVRQRENFEEKFISCDADGSGQKHGMKKP